MTLKEEVTSKVQTMSVRGQRRVFFYAFFFLFAVDTVGSNLVSGSHYNLNVPACLSYEDVFSVLFFFVSILTPPEGNTRYPLALYDWHSIGYNSKGSIRCD
eukprot:XP_014776280.1 PREDICTED: uncharacterized protein LOC106873442 isoform X1 [Octopus bimaculoides]